MNQIRIEVRLSIIAHVGPDIPEHDAPAREPDATECIKLVRVSPAGGWMPRHHVTDLLHSMLASVEPICGERITHQLISAKRAADHAAAQ